MLKKLLLTSSIFCLAPAQAQDPAPFAPMYVSGSFVNVRVSPSKNGDVIEKLAINTSVRLYGRSDDFCEITWGTGLRGFIACDFLNAKPLTLADVGSEKLPDGSVNPNFSVVRAFWLQPTFAGFISVGQFYETTMVSKGLKALEKQYVDSGGQGGPMEIKRQPITEWDAMKARLSQGVIAPKEVMRLPLPWNVRSPGWLPDEPAHRWVLKQIKLRAVKPSFFQNPNDIASPKLTPESLSAQFGIPWTLTVTQPSYWGGDNNAGPSRVGVWDVGGVSQKLAAPVFTYAIDDKGNLVKSQTVAEFRSAPYDLGPSSGAMPWPNDSTPEAAATDRRYFVAFHSSANLRSLKAKVAVSNENRLLLQPADIASTDKFVRAEITYFDLDGDGVQDLALWNAFKLQDGTNWGEEASFRIFFINIGGRWHLLDYDEDPPSSGC